MTAGAANGKPYVGPRPFKVGELLFGRDRELRDLSDLLTVERLVLLHSPSGAGKTSLVQAGLIPRLEQKGFKSYGPLRVNRAPLEKESRLAANRFAYSVLFDLVPTVAPTPEPRAEDWQRLALAQFFDRCLSNDRGRQKEFLFFDQFEEILTTDPVDVAAKRAFFEQLGVLLQAPQRYALFAVREEYVAALEPYVGPVPRGLTAHFRLELLGTEAARDAIVKPAIPFGFTIEPEAADALVNDLRQVRVQQLGGKPTTAYGQFVEPVQLQVVCLRIWEQRQGQSLKADEIPRLIGNVDTALTVYYADEVRAIAQTRQDDEATIRDWIAQNLITKDRLRNRILMETEKTRGLDNQTIRALVNAYLIREEESGSKTWYELAHDRLIEPVIDDNEKWFRTNLNDFQAQARVWHDRGRPLELLASPDLVAEGERLATSGKSLTDVETSYLRQSREARRLREESRLRQREEAEAQRALAKQESIRREFGPQRTVLQITLQRRFARNWPVVLEQSIAGFFLPVRTEGALALNAEDISQGLRGITDAKEYGTLLGHALFGGEIREAFTLALARSQALVHVLLFVEDTELKGLHWEWLCAPVDGKWEFLATNVRTPFSLHLPSTTDHRFPSIGRSDLRALIVAANPRQLERFGLEAFDATAAVTGVQRALGEISSTVLADVPGSTGLPTLEHIIEHLSSGNYPLLHLIGHSRRNRGDGEIGLFLTTSDDQVALVTWTRLLDRFRTLARVPYFIFLASCDTAESGAGEALGGLGQRLVEYLGIPAVLAMKGQVSFQTVQELSAVFYHRLRDHGIVDLALAEARASLGDRPDGLVPTLYSRLGGQALFSETVDRPLTPAEIERGVTRAARYIEERAPVLVQGFLQLAEAVSPNALAAAPKRSAESEQALARINDLCEEALDLQFHSLAFGREPLPYDARCPFRGLQPFRVDDSEFFFGREALVARLEERLEIERFLALVGSSGCGKSSLVLAGLVPAFGLRYNNFKFAYMLPGSDPIESLNRALSENDQLSLFILDQFEELFTLTPVNRRRPFLDRLLKLSEKMRVAITLRADFFGECTDYPELGERLRLGLIPIAPMEQSELRRAMERQAAAVGLRFEADLVNTILDEVRDEPGIMPLWQFALQELWKRRHGRWLRSDEYRAIGGVSAVVARTADEFYVSRSSEEQEQIQELLLRLIRVNEDGASSRRRVPREELRMFGNASHSTASLIDGLVNARLLTTSANPVTGFSEVEVAHEALITRWPRFSGWVQSRGKSLQLLQVIRERAQEWRRRGNATEFLLSRSLLQEADNLLDPWDQYTQSEIDYLEASKAFDTRNRRRQFLIVSFLIVGLAYQTVLIIGRLLGVP
jgi:CHAT domain